VITRATHQTRKTKFAYHLDPMGTHGMREASGTLPVFARPRLIKHTSVVTTAHDTSFGHFPLNRKF
jgi:hypothetical protein